jgi:putative tricarboxylic transport membrane protein
LSRWLTADRIVGIVLLAVSIFFMLQALQLVNDIAPIFRDQPMRLDTMPKIIGLVAIIASLITIFMPSTATRAVKDPQLQAAQAQQKEGISCANLGDYAVGQLAAMVALMSVYALVLRPFGFIPATAAFLFLASFLLGERRWWTMLLVATLTPGLIWLLVTYVLERRIVAWPQFLGL